MGTRTGPRQLDTLISSVPDLSAPSTTKFAEVRAFIAETTQLSTNEVYVVFVSKPGNAKVRFEQSGADDEARLGVAILANPADARASASAVDSLVCRGRRAGAP